MTHDEKKNERLLKFERCHAVGQLALNHNCAGRHNKRDHSLLTGGMAASFDVSSKPLLPQMRDENSEDETAPMPAAGMMVEADAPSIIVD